jgi:predicted RNase H-like HicB family nuclease
MEDEMAEGKTLDEAFENFAEEKARGLMSEFAELTFEEAMKRFDEAWYPVQIAIRTQPHNQWVRTYRVTDR